MANPKELQKFLDVWGPVVASLPTVINAIEHEAELEKHVVQLQAQVKAAQDATQQALAEKTEGVLAVEARLQELTAKKRELDLELKAYTKTCADAVAQAAKDTEVRLLELAAKCTQTEAAVAIVQQSLVTQLADADAQVAARLDSAKAELTAIEQRKATAEAAFEALKAKLG